MKTSDLVTLGLVGVIGYIAYQKYGSKNPPPDFGVNNPNDPNWGDSSVTPQLVKQGFVDQLISQASEWTL